MSWDKMREKKQDKTKTLEETTWDENWRDQIKWDGKEKRQIKKKQDIREKRRDEIRWDKT